MNKYMMMAAGAVLALASCNNASPKMDEQPTTAEPASAGGLKIAYVEVDSLMTQYEFCKEFTLTLQKKGNNARNTLNQKGQQLQNAAANFQQKLQNNGFTSSSRNCRTTDLPVVSRPRASRLPSSVSSRACRSCRPVWRTSWPPRLRNTTRLCATR